VILPDSEVYVPCAMPKEINQATIDAIVNGPYELIFWGVVQYTDRFGGGPPHTTKFCYFYDRSTKSMGICRAPGTVDAN
jgi:hypothetical protein